MQNPFFRLKNFSIVSFFALGFLFQSSSLLGQSSSENFSLMLEKKRWGDAENWIDRLPANDKHAIALSSLQLAHAYGNSGLKEKALQLLTSHWKEIETSKLAPYGLMLKARLIMTAHPDQAWDFFKQAKETLAIEEWPAQDASAYFQLKQEREQAFDLELHSLSKLVDSGLYLEAIASLDRTLSMLLTGCSDEFDPSATSGKVLYRHLLLTKAQVLQDLKQPDLALSIFEKWPSVDDSSIKATLRAQDLNRNYIRGLCLLDLNKSKEALSELTSAYENSHESTTPILMRLRCSLALSQALHQCHQSAQALLLLESAEPLIYECNSHEQNLAQFAWTKQSVNLLIETGQLHKAFDQLQFQLKLRHDPRSKAGLLLLKSKLLELMNEKESATTLYIELFSYPLTSIEQEELTKKVLAVVDTPTPNEKVAVWQKNFCDLILSSKRPDLSDKLRLEVSDWLIRQSLVKTQELRFTLRLWLKDLERGPWEAHSLYILAQLEPASAEKQAYFKRLLQCKNLPPTLEALAQAQLLTLEPGSAQVKLEKMLELASRCEGKAKEMILTSAIDLSLEENVFIDFRAHLPKITAGSALDIVYQEYKLSQLKTSDRSSCFEALKKGAERSDLWGLRASFTLTKHLLTTETAEKAIEPLIKWSNLTSIHESLRREAWMHIADIYYQQGNMALARKYIAQTLERWDHFEERPWLQLRQYSEQEYLLGSPESVRCLKDLQEKYPNHPACLTASIIQARSVQNLHGYSVQTLKAWEDTLTTAKRLQKTHSLDQQAQETYVIALIEKSKCLSHLGMQRQALTSLKSAMHSEQDSALNLDSEFEKQLRFELARLHQKMDDLAAAQEELEWICRDPFPSKWQTAAAFELAEIELSKSEPEPCLSRLEKVTCYNEEQLQKRLLLAARACHLLNQKQERQAYLSELMKRPLATPVQDEALWYVYLWNSDSPQVAHRALQKLSQSKHPLALKAKEKLSGPSQNTGEK